MSAFRYAHASGRSWRDCVQGCAKRLGTPAKGLGFVYFTDFLVDRAAEIVAALRDHTGVADWVGTVGIGVLAAGAEYQDEPALAAMVAEFEPGSYRIFSGRSPLKPGAHFAVVHADPTAPDIVGLVSDLASKIESGYLVGGLSSSRTRNLQVANDVLTGGLSGVTLGPEIGVATRLTQGCSPLSERFRVTACEDNIVQALDGRPALEVLLEAVKGVRTPILVALPVAGSDTGDYMVRNLIGVDPKEKLIAIGEPVEPGAELIFCRRDAQAARKDLERMLAELRREAPAPRGALYFSCTARGEHMFGSRGAELGLVRDALGEVPLVGFFCNGEISHDRVYGYTGVLTVFH